MGRYLKLSVIISILLLLISCSEQQMDTALDDKTVEGSIAESQNTKKKDKNAVDLQRVAKPKWRKVASFTGKKNQKTPAFKISGSEWKVEWEVKKGKKDDGEFIIILCNSKDKDDQEIITTQVGPGKEFADFDQTGESEYFLDINAEQPFEVTILEYK